MFKMIVRYLDLNMTKIPMEETNERREKVWFLMLKGHNPQSIIKILRIPGPTIYNDLKFLTEKSREYLYDASKGTHILIYQKAIEGIGLTLSEAWKRFNDPKLPERQRLGYLRLTRECYVSMCQVTSQGPHVMAIEELKKKMKDMGMEALEYGVEINFNPELPKLPTANLNKSGELQQE